MTTLLLTVKCHVGRVISGRELRDIAFVMGWSYVVGHKPVPPFSRIKKTELLSSSICIFWLKIIYFT